MAKKIIIITVVLFLIISLVAFYYLFPREEDDTRTGFLDSIFGGGGRGLPIHDIADVPDSTDAGGGNIIETSTQAGLTLTSFDVGPVAGLAVNSGENAVLYYKRDTGNLYMLPFDEVKPKKMSDLVIPRVVGADWSSNKTASIISSADENGNLNYHTVSYIGTSTAETLLPKTIYSPTISPDGKSIAYAIRREEGSSIIISSPDGNSIENIYSPSFSEYELTWVSPYLISLNTKASSFADSVLITVSTNGETDIEIRPRTGLTSIFSPDGKQILYSEFIGGGPFPSIYVKDLGEDNETSLPFETISEKCAWSNLSSKIIYCAVPEEYPNLPLPDAWWKGQVSFNDEIWAVNTETGEVNILWGEGGFDAVNLVISPNDEFVFFINKKDSSLWRLELPKDILE